MQLPDTLECVLREKVHVRLRIVERMEEMLNSGAVSPEEIDDAYLAVLDAQEDLLRERERIR